VSEKLP